MCELLAWALASGIALLREPRLPMDLPKYLLGERASGRAVRGIVTLDNELCLFPSMQCASTARAHAQCECGPKTEVGE